MVYNFATLSLIDQISTCPNTRISCAISGNDDVVLACPSSRQGEILVKSFRSQTSCVIAGHANNILGIAMNTSGSRIATASERGTIIRVFDTRNTKEALKTVRRGTNPASIQSLALNSLGTELAVGSDTGTVHLFSCEEGANNYNTSSYLWYLGSSEETSGYRIYVKNEPSPNVAFSNEKGTLFATGSTMGCWKFTYGAQPTETQLMPALAFIPRD